MSIFGPSGAGEALGGGAVGGGVEKEYVDSRDALRVLKAGDTMGGDLNMDGHRIVGVADPADPQDAASAAFVLDAATQVKAGVISRDGTPSATMQADLDLDGNGLVRVRDPLGPQDAATKKYADTRDNLRVLKAGDTMTGSLDMSGNRVTGLSKNFPPPDTGDAVSWAQALGLANDLQNDLVTRTGDTMVGDLAMSGNKITGLGTPTAAQDAVTKSYADSRRAYITVWAEENSSMNSGEYEWSFGNGATGADHSRIGYVMMAPGRVVRMSLSTTTASGAPSGAIRVDLVVNGAVQPRAVTKPSGLYSGTAIFATPLELLLGDRINFRSATNDSVVTKAIVSLLIELDL